MQLNQSRRGDNLKLLIDLFSTDYGLLSLGVIAFVLVMGAYLTRYFIKHMQDNS